LIYSEDYSISNIFNVESNQNSAAAADTFFENKLNKRINLGCHNIFLKEKLQKLFDDKLTLEPNNAVDMFRRSLNYLIALELEEQFFIGFYNIAKRNHLALAHEFNLHKAIYENNLKKIYDICKNER